MNTTAQQPVSFELIERAFTSPHYPKLFCGEDTHQPARDLAFQLALYTDDRDLIDAIANSGLPDDYNGDTRKELPAMIASAMRKLSQKPMVRAKSQTIASKLLALVQNADAELFHDQGGRQYVSIPQPNRSRQNYRLASQDAKMWLRKLFYGAYGEALPNQPLTEVLDTLAARANFDGELHAVEIRVGPKGRRDIY